MAGAKGVVGALDDSIVKLLAVARSEMLIDFFGDFDSTDAEVAATATTAAATGGAGGGIVNSDNVIEAKATEFLIDLSKSLGVFSEFEGLNLSLGEVGHENGSSETDLHCF